MRLVSPDGTEFRGLYRGRERVGFALRRLDLDGVLLDCARAAGAEVREGARVGGLLREGEQVTGVALAAGGSIAARAVVGADGRRSVVGRQLGLLREHPRLRRFAVRGHWSGASGLDGSRGDARRPAEATAASPLCRPRLPTWPSFSTPARWRMPAATWRASTATSSGSGGRPSRTGSLRPSCARPPRAIGPLALECRGVSRRGCTARRRRRGILRPVHRRGGDARPAHGGTRRGGDRRGTAVAPRRSRPLPRLRSYDQARHACTRDKFRFNRLLQLAVTRPWLANAVARRLARRPRLADRLVGIAGDFVPARSAWGPRFVLDLLLG